MLLQKGIQRDSAERNDPILRVVADVRAAAERDAGAGAPILDNGDFVAAEFGVVRKHVG